MPRQKRLPGHSSKLEEAIEAVDRIKEINARLDALEALDE